MKEATVERELFRLSSLPVGTRGFKEFVGPRKSTGIGKMRAQEESMDLGGSHRRALVTGYLLQAQKQPRSISQRNKQICLAACSRNSLSPICPRIEITCALKL